MRYEIMLAVRFSKQILLQNKQTSGPDGAVEVAWRKEDHGEPYV